MSWWTAAGHPRNSVLGAIPALPLDHASALANELPEVVSMSLTAPSVDHFVSEQLWGNCSASAAPIGEKLHRRRDGWDRTSSNAEREHK